MDLVETCTCNAVFQQSASVMNIGRHGQNHRVPLFFPSSFDVAALISRLRLRQNRYNIRVCHFSGASYSMDLSKLEKVMSKVYEADHASIYNLDDFRKHKLSKASHWLDCLFDCDDSLGNVVCHSYEFGLRKRSLALPMSLLTR